MTNHAIFSKRLARAMFFAVLSVFCLFSLAGPSPAATAALLPNGGFEQTQSAPGGAFIASAWTSYGQGYAMDAKGGRLGGAGIRCENHDLSAVSGAFQTVTLNQTTPAPVVISGWSKAEGVSGAPGGDYALYVDLTYADGTNLWGQISEFETGTHGWSRRSITFMPHKALKSLNVYALFRYHTGVAWFDDFDVHTTPMDKMFDSQDLALPKTTSTSGGWLMRDAAHRGSVLAVTPHQTLAGVELTASSATDKIVTASFQNTATTSAAVTIYYAQRLKASEPVTWWNDMRDRQTAAGGEYANLQNVNVGVGYVSLYPFGCVTTAKAGYALAIPPAQQPCVARIEYNSRANLFYAAYDIALAPKGDSAGHDRVTLRVARYAVSPEWAFRDASARYYALYPEAFQRRNKSEGVWIPFTAPQFVANPKDFQIAYHEGDNSVGSDRALGILSFRYVEPMTYWMPMKKDAPRTYAEAMAQVKRQAAGPVDNAERRQSQAVLSSGTKDSHGLYNVAFRDTPWCDGAVFVLNPSPALPHVPGLWSKAMLNAAGKPALGKANEPDGEYLDSLEAWADTLNYQPATLRAASGSLTWDSNDFKPVVPTWFSVYDSTQALSQDLHRHGKLLMANSTPLRFHLFAPLLDVIGTETDMFPSGAWEPEPDSQFNLRRTMCYHKPYLMLLNTDFTKIGSEQIELYFQRCMFYAVFPSMFSVNAADHPYWENAALYNRDRPLFQKYIPVISHLSHAGWEPITWARSSDQDVWVERYGANYLTVLNSLKTPRTVTVTIDTDKFAGAKALRLHDDMTGQSVTATRAPGGISVTMTLAPSETRVLALR
ncbi:hypothetical protein CCAX7_41180 [Capsulimonas corticalis]|uniref:Uncharacterized protein n=1 Tax=Capsulimonas corticalis TaxID=2219043 RepID=A0A402D666_9BACT|nr:hypothetical protein [Capsulimonas corticalis]BDI32067.1 hypothetical protein CCAX7_41180 [Capsulimonas corticalis]